MNHVTQTTCVKNPPLPYLTDISGGCLTPGKVIKIDGFVPSNACSFEVNFRTGRLIRDSTAFQFRPRFDLCYIARNSRQKSVWGDHVWGREEQVSSRRNPISRGHGFSVLFFPTEQAFLVAVNGTHFCEFEHRLPFEMVNTLQIRGDVYITEVKCLESSIYPPPWASIFPPRDCEGSHCNHLNGDNPQGCRDNQSHILNVKEPCLPFSEAIPGNMSIGKEIEIAGKVKTLPHRFYINLQQGRHRHPHPIVPFHFNPRFEGRNVVLRNAYIDQWGDEESLAPRFPFRPRRNFHIKIRCEQANYCVAVNNTPFITFNHRVPVYKTDTIRIEGDVHIQSVHIK